MPAVELQIDAPEEMHRLGEALAGLLKPGDIVAINGTLGAGKTLLCKGVLAGLGYQGDVASPTFTIANHYDPPLTKLPVVHADIYRLENAADLDELGLLDGYGLNALLLVEWARKFDAVTRVATVLVDIESLSGNMRAVSITGEQHLLEGLHGLGFTARS